MLSLLASSRYSRQQAIEGQFSAAISNDFKKHIDTDVHTYGIWSYRIGTCKFIDIISKDVYTE